MSTIVTRTGKGSALTWAEADNNFTNLNTDKIQVSTITGTAGKTPLVDADLIPIIDSVGTALNKVTWANVKASLVTYFNTLYSKVGAITSSGLTQSTSKLLGRTTAATGAVEEISVGSGLSLTAGSLTAPTMTASVAGIVPTPPNNTTTFLRGDGTFAAPATAGITLGTVTATTSGTSIDFTSLPAGMKRITVSLKGVSTSGTSRMILRFGTAGGIQTSTYQGRTTGGQTSMNNTVDWTDGVEMRHIASADASGTTYGSVTFTLMDASNNIWSVSGSDVRFVMTAESSFMAGIVTLSGAVTTLRLTTAGGSDTFDAGSMNIAYE